MPTEIDEMTSTVYISDNLPFLKSIPTQSVDLVCIDPPFGKRQTFVGTIKPPLSSDELRIEREMLLKWGITDLDSAYDAGLEWPDQRGLTAKFDEIWNFSRHVYAGWIQSLEMLNPGLDLLIKATRYTQGDGVAAYIAFMAERMFEIKRILKSTGSVYLHCDHEAEAYLRQMMDAIFGKGNFRTAIRWPRHNSRQKGSQHAPKSWGSTLDTILFYAKSKSAGLMPWREMTPEERQKKFPLSDPDGRRYYDDSAHIWRTPNMGARPNLCYTWQKEGHSYTNPHPSGWRLSRERLEEEYARGNFVILPSGKLQRRKYEDEWRGTTVGNLWDDISPDLGKEDVGYPTQKPQALARRIIEASSPENGIVIDCFAGCAYVPVAAQLSGRRWIACDMSPRAWTVIRRQFHKHPALGIRTEGEIAPDPDEPNLRAELQMLGTMVKVRGPHELPPPAVATASQAHMKGITELKAPRYRVQPEETADQIWEAFVQEWGTSCWYCGEDKNRDRRELQLDHIEPKALDGSNDDCWNRALACSPCNSDKSNRLTPEETIRQAREAGRIATDRLMTEQIARFSDREAWAKKRWAGIGAAKKPILF